MAWKDTTKMDQKIEFINEWRSGQFSITQLSRQFEISRPTAYKWIKRFGGQIRDSDQLIIRIQLSYQRSNSQPSRRRDLSVINFERQWPGAADQHAAGRSLVDMRNPKGYTEVL